MSRLDTCLHSFSRVYPDYPFESVESNDQGQNTDVLIVNQTLILRFPSYTQGIQDLKVDMAILRSIRGYVSLKIPNPQGVRERDRRISLKRIRNII